MERERIGRRTVLKRAGAASVGGIVASTAGCIGGPPIGGSGAGSYASWLPAPGDIDDSDHYSFYKISPTVFAEHEDELDSDGYDQFETYFSGGGASMADIDFDETDQIVAMGSAVVYSSQVPQEDVVDELEDNDFDDDTDHEGYTIFVSPDERNAAGVNGETVVWGSRASQSTDAVEVVEGVIDTEAGEEDRYADDSEDFGVLIDTLGDGDFVYGRTTEEGETDDPESGQFRDLVATGSRFDIDAETSEVMWVYVFEDEDDVDIEDFEDYVDENDGSDGTFDDVDDVSIEASGRAVIISGTQDTDDLL